MEYISYQKLIEDIKINFIKVPKDILGVIGVPRSGMLPATIIANQLNVGLCTINEFVEKGAIIFDKNHGNRKLRSVQSKKILVVDDTCYNGTETKKNRAKLSCFNEEYEFVYMCIYLEGNCIVDKPDLYLVNIVDKVKNSGFDICLYEWNLFSNPAIMEKTIFDLDGVLCAEPPDERNLTDYLHYINNPIPLIVPTLDRITVCTYRLIKYKEETLKFLDNVGLTEKMVYMFNSNTYEERSKTPPYVYKSYIYNKLSDYKLFVESNDNQAREICKITKKPVYCVETNKLYNLQ